MVTSSAESTVRTFGGFLLTLYADLIATAHGWWAEFDEACRGRDLTPDDAELELAFLAKRCGLSPTAALVSIVDIRSKETVDA